ncbi:nas-7, partial [Pristionchus pacificus]
KMVISLREQASCSLAIVAVFLAGLTNAYGVEYTEGLTEDDFEMGAKLTNDEVFGHHIPVEEVNSFKSDIRGPYANRRRHKRNGVSRIAKLWPSGKIPYAISPHYSSHERALLARAVKAYHEKTCIRFVPRAAGETDYLFIGKVDGCFSEVGRTSGVQVLSLDNGCMEYATIIHEMMHVVGFYHEHERWDRDSFIDIIWQNIDKGALDQFGKVDLSKTSYYGQSYDYKSILHYDSLAFSKNGFPTMLPKARASTIGNAKDFSEVDLAKINRMYNCPAPKSLTAPFSSRAHSSQLYSPSLKAHESYYPRPSSSSHQQQLSSSAFSDPLVRRPNNSVLVDGGSVQVTSNPRDDAQSVSEDVRLLLSTEKPVAVVETSSTSAAPAAPETTPSTTPLTTASTTVPLSTVPSTVPSITPSTTPQTTPSNTLPSATTKVWENRHPSYLFRLVPRLPSRATRVDDLINQ